MFYDCLCLGKTGLVNRGHCGISFGSSGTIHAWDKVRTDDYLQIENLTALTGGSSEIYRMGTAQLSTKAETEEL